MIEQIKAVLAQLGIKEYRIMESVQASIECFFVRKKLDLKRRTDLTDYDVVVFCPHEQDGEKIRKRSGDRCRKRTMQQRW